MDNYEIGAHFGTTKKAVFFRVNLFFLRGKTINLEFR